MGAFKCDTDALSGRVNPNLNSAQSSLNEGASILSSITIPSTFSLAGSLSAMPNTVRNNSEKVSSLKKWVSDVVNKFTNAENANNAKVNQLNSSISNIVLSSSSAAVATGSAGINSITNFFSNIVDVIDNLFNNYLESESAINATNAQISDSYESSTLIEGDFSLLSSIFDNVKNLTATAVCTLYNASASIAKGFAQFIGALLDGVTIVGTSVLTLATGIWDIGSYFFADSSPSLKDFCEYMGDGATAVMWKNVMGFVSTSFIQDFFSKAYDSPLGQFIDDNAIGIFKSDAIGCDVLSGLSYVGGIVISTILTLGVAGGVAGASAGAGTAASAATGAVASSTTSTIVSSAFAAISALGKYTGESWAEDKFNSWEGIREAYMNGDISYDDYKSMLLIRNMSDEEWLDIYGQVGKGEISWEQLEQLKQIRNIPDDWQNLENWGAGMAYGTSNAIWEGLQYLVGGLLGGAKFLTGKIGSAVRVGVDTIFNMADTPFRTLITAGTTGKSIGDVFETNGGWSSVLADTLVGLIGSVGGEIFDGIKANKKAGIEIDEFNTLQDLDLETWNNLKKDLSNLYGYNADEIFERWRKATGGYGVDQSSLKKLYLFQTPEGFNIDGINTWTYKNYRDAGISLKKYATTTEYLNLKEWLKNTYNLSSRDAAEIITMLDSVGACTYADVCNELVTYFTKSPELQNLFLNKFGFPIIEYADNGNVKINAEKLLLDMFITVNDKGNGGKLIETLSDGSKIIDWTKATMDINRYAELADANVQQYLMYYNKMNDNAMNNYLEVKGLNKKYTSKVITNPFFDKGFISDKDKKKLINKVTEAIEENSLISMYIASGNGPIRFIAENGSVFTTTDNWSEGGAHAVFITGISQAGFIVSSWGEKLIIPFADLIKSGQFNIFANKIS